MAKFTFLSTLIFLLLLTTPTDTHASGFGGVHRGGGMHVGGGMHMSAPHISAPHMNVPQRSGNFGGARPNMGNFGGARPGGANFAGNRANLGRSSANRNQIKSGPLAGLGGVGSLGKGPLAGPSSQFKFPGTSVKGFGGAVKPNPFAAHAGATPRKSTGLGSGSAATNPGNVAKSAKAPSRDQLHNFLGLPGDGGMHSLASHRPSPVSPSTGRVGERLGPDRLGPDRLGPDRLGADRLGADRPGNRPGPIRPEMDQRGHVRHAVGDLARHGDYVRHNFHGHGYDNRDWYGRHRGCWYPRRWAYGTVWAAWDWAYLNGWFGWGAEPIYYDYGNTVYYQDNSVYVNGENVGTTDEYYQQASDLAAASDEATNDVAPADGDDGEWLPLGVFAMTNDDHTKANLLLQLAVNKEGTIRGNYTATLVDHTLPVQGSVDKKTQRAAWTIGKEKENVFETGVDNLTKDQAPMLIHLGKDKTQQWTLVRLKNNDDTSATPSDADASKDPEAPKQE